MKNILLTGFEPFAGDTLNASWEAVRGLGGQYLDEAHLIVSELLPCTFEGALQRLGQLIALHQPVLVIAVGQAGGRTAFSLERVAINLQDAAIADNAGHKPIDQPVIVTGPAAYFSTLPIKAIVAGLRDQGIPAEVSQSAGTYVCNTVFYGLMHAASGAGAPLRAGFVHIPYLPEQAANKAGAASMPAALIAQGLRSALSIALTVKQDVALSAGRTH
jgi:pyroglutamyl-peptidase